MNLIEKTPGLDVLKRLDQIPLAFYNELLYLDSRFGGVRLNDVPKFYTVKSGFRRP